MYQKKSQKTIRNNRTAKWLPLQIQNDLLLSEKCLIYIFHEILWPLLLSLKSTYLYRCSCAPITFLHTEVLPFISELPPIQGINNAQLSLLLKMFGYRTNLRIISIKIFNVSLDKLVAEYCSLYIETDTMKLGKCMDYEVFYLIF